MLDKIYKNYHLPLELYIKIKKQIGIENNKELHEQEKFLETLPYQLRVIVSLYIYESRYEKLTFFKNRETNLILWLCPNLKPRISQQGEYIFVENEVINEVVFMTKGRA